MVPDGDSAALRLVWEEFASRTAMVAVGLVAVGAWRRWSGAAWRWFAAGAAIWTVGVAV